MAYLQQLNAAFDQLAKARDQDDLFRRAIIALHQTLGFDRAGLLLFDRATNEQVGTWGTDTEGKLRNEYNFRAPVTDNLILSASEERIRLTHDADLLEMGQAVDTGWHIQSAIFSGNDLCGWLFIDNLVNHKPLSDDEFELIKAFSNVLGQLVVRCQVEDTLLSAIDSLAQNEDLTSSALERISQLESQLLGNRKLVKLAERLSGLVPMSNRAVGNLLNFMSLLSPSQFGEADQALLESAKKSADQLARIFRHFDEKVHEATDNDYQKLPASTIQDYWLRQFNSLYRNSPHELEVITEKPEEEITVPLILLTQLVKELIRNSLQHGLEHSPQGRTRIHLKKQSQLLIVTVEDNGAGLDPDQYQDVLKLFVTSKPYECLGSGLNVTQHYVERWLNGQLDLGPSELGGLRCSLQIPVVE